MKAMALVFGQAAERRGELQIGDLEKAVDNYDKQRPEIAKVKAGMPRDGGEVGVDSTQVASTSGSGEMIQQTASGASAPITHAPQPAPPIAIPTTSKSAPPRDNRPLTIKFSPNVVKRKLDQEENAARVKGADSGDHTRGGGKGEQGTFYVLVPPADYKTHAASDKAATTSSSSKSTEDKSGKQDRGGGKEKARQKVVKSVEYVEPSDDDDTPPPTGGAKGKMLGAAEALDAVEGYNPTDEDRIVPPCNSCAARGHACHWTPRLVRKGTELQMKEEGTSAKGKSKAQSKGKGKGRESARRTACDLCFVGKVRCEGTGEGTSEAREVTEKPPAKKRKVQAAPRESILSPCKCWTNSTNSFEGRHPRRCLPHHCHRHPQRLPHLRRRNRENGPNDQIDSGRTSGGSRRYGTAGGVYQRQDRHVGNDGRRAQAPGSKARRGVWAFMRTFGGGRLLFFYHIYLTLFRRRTIFLILYFCVLAASRTIKILYPTIA